MANVIEQLAEAVHADPHERVLHAKGTWFDGSFTPSPERGALAASTTLFSAGTHRVVGRFSGNRGGASSHDADTGDQGLSMRIGSSAATMDLMMFTLPVFFVRNGHDLIDFLKAVTPDSSGTPPRRELLEEFLLHHPEAASAIAAQQPGTSASYVGQSYHAVHAYGFVDNDATTWHRLVLHPDVVRNRLDLHEARELPSNYLEADLRAAVRPRFHLDALQPAAGDALHDPTAPWVGKGYARLGTVTIDRVLEHPPDPQPQLDPLNLPPGIEPPRDALIRDRSEAYRIARSLRSKAPSASVPRTSGPPEIAKTATPGVVRRARRCWRCICLLTRSTQ